MKHLATFILTLKIFCCNTQPNVSHIPTYTDGDTTLWYGWKMELADELKLDNLLTSPEFRFRFWTDNQLVDLSNESGTVICYEREYKENDWKREKKRRLHSKKFDLSQADIDQLHELLNSSGLLQLPSEDEIVGWAKGHDGITYTVELTTNNEYHFRTYWTPGVQLELTEAKLVFDFVNDLNELLQLKTKYDQFFADYLRDATTTEILP